MAEVDTSSYPKAAPPKSFVDVVGDLNKLDLQQLQLNQGAVTLEKQKYDLMMQRFGNLAKGLTQLGADPELNEDKIRKYGQNLVSMGIIPADMAGKVISNMPPTQGMTPQQATATLKPYVEGLIQQAQDTESAIKFQYGQPGTLDTGQTVQPVVTSPRFGVQSTNAPIQKQLPPDTRVFDDKNQPRILGPQPAQAAPGATTAPPPRGGLRDMVAPQPQQSTQPQTAPQIQPSKAVPEQNNQPPTFNDRFDASFKSGPSPLFESGRDQLTKDQELSTQKLTAIKPALLALDLIPGLRTGPGTETWNRAIAGLKANNIIPTETKNDPTAVYQEVNKYLHQYLKGRGGRSDADLQAAEASSPNPGTQINPALLKLTQTAVAQDRIEAARAPYFQQGLKRDDIQNYGSYRSNFPSKLDERAFYIDKMTPEQKQELAKELKKMKPAEKQRFINSLKIFEQSGVGSQ